MDSMVKQSVIEIGSVMLSAKPKLDNELPLLDCDGSSYFVTDYPILASKLERKFIEPSIIPTEITHANVSEYMNSNSTVKVIGGVLHIYTATTETVGVLTSSDGQAFTFTEFSSLRAKANYAPAIIRASDDGQTLLTCSGLTSFVSKNGGATWVDETHSATSVTALQYWDVSPSGNNMFCVSNNISSKRTFFYKYNGGAAWLQNNINHAGNASRFYYINESYFIFASGSSSDDGVYRAFNSSGGGGASSVFDTSSLRSTILARDGVALANAGEYGGTSSNYSRYYISKNTASTWVGLPQRNDLFGNNLALNTLIDFLLTANNDLYVANSDGVFLLADGAKNWSRVFKPNSVAEQITGQARLAEINGDVFIITATAFYKTDSVLEDYLFFTPDLSDSPLNSVCKLVGDRQP
ncbi:hypothetical protein V6257_11960 [Pseudoalteromonas issachenkonii]|uniref:Photosynthesis system II assembly factor Ycf48/Hcf136-like domain-containing protein n=1 Tax=Pseudoalteromonas issachenkonii TaxID=152297 RepID=A0ABU9H1L9_9GAMM